MGGHDCGVQLRAGVLNEGCSCDRKNGRQEENCPRMERCAVEECHDECREASNGDYRCHHGNGNGQMSDENGGTVKSEEQSGRKERDNNNGYRTRRNMMIRLGQMGYIDNPPLPPPSFKPCAVHSRRRF
ncbi:hypothetical protein LSTR_LSTR005503 [Laodelphax striatellus]|uniref:Uncharacterized protein n=1 Tax=Laodelphax striatellus TaxID=195883 RepID=A0A482WXV2_LAOST|nr:hypothetical protein LSTR_LSTR005503 [Laodelphax striatellus]